MTLLNMLGKHRDAYDAIASHDFQTWEGAEGKITAQFKISLLEQAREALHERDGAEAEKLLGTALSYPENLGEGRLEGTKDNHLLSLYGRRKGGDRSSK